jgi:hypothetical protein
MEILRPSNGSSTKMRTHYFRRTISVLLWIENGDFRMNWARVKIAVLTVVAFSVALQFIQPKRTNPPTIASRALSAHVQVPGQVQAALNRACGDCHSNQTVWPWYSRVAPFSWVVTDDVNQGRRHVNLDDWEAQQSPKQAHDHLIDICKEVTAKGMPPFTYRIAHPAVQLKTKEMDVLCSWSRSFDTDPESGVGTVR